MILYCFKCRTRAGLDHPCFRPIVNAVACALMAFPWMLGCAAHKPLQIDTGVSYTVAVNPKHCDRLPNGKIHCKDAILDPKEVRVQR